MTTTVQSTIPWIDMGQFLAGTAEQKLTTSRAFGEALQQVGFVAVTNIGLSTATIDQAYLLAETFFNLSETEKMCYHATDGHHGFIPFGTEHAKYTDVMDLKEFFQTTGNQSHPANLWPAIPGFKEAISKLYTELENCMKACLQATAIYLGYQHNQQTILSDMLGTGNGLMRMLHYPPVDPAICPPGAVRSAAHEDLSMMTVIPRATSRGLQVKNLNDEWLDVIVPENAAIINAGDTLNYITNGIIPSTTHRVINPKEGDYSHRYSIPFFGSLPFDVVMRALDKCRRDTLEKDLPKEITFGEFLTKRYQEIGIKA